MIISSQINTSKPFRYNPKAFGGTEYMGRRFEKLIAPHMPKLDNYLSLIVPGWFPTFESFLRQPKQVLMWMHNTPQQFGLEELSILKSKEFQDKLKYLIVPSESAKREALEQANIPEDKICVIPNAIEPLKYNSVKFTNTDKVKLINTSSPDRGLDVLLTAIKKVDEDFEMDVFSRFNPNETPGYEPDPRVNFYGFSYKNTVRKHYEAAHIHAYPSTYPETFCISQAEAMSAGLLCITSDLGALPEVSGGQTTIYKFIKDPITHADIFAKYLTRAIQDVKSGNWNPEAQIKYINETYSWETIKQKWIDFHNLI